MILQPGDVIQLDFGNPIGSEPGFVRPAVVVSAAFVLEEGPRTVHVVPITSNIQRGWPTDVLVEAVGLDVDSAAQCHLCTVVGIERIIDESLGNVGSVALAEIRSLLADLLDIV